jgi:threonyl-tRNA synthetase
MKNLFFEYSSMVGEDLPLWKPYGANLRGVLENHIKEAWKQHGYQQIYTPHIGKIGIYKQANIYPNQVLAMYENSYEHLLDLCQYKLSLNPEKAESEQLNKFILKLFEMMNLSLKKYSDATNDKERAKVLLDWLTKQEIFYLRLSSSVNHIYVYNAERKTHYHLPYRLAEISSVYSKDDNKIFTLTQDEVNVFCEPHQIESELSRIVQLAKTIFEKLNLKLKLKVQENLVHIIEPLDVDYEIDDSYEIKFTSNNFDLGSVFVNNKLPHDFQLEYIGKDNQEHCPVMICGTCIGSFENFCENFL